MSKKPATKAEKQWMGMVKSLPCIVCYPGWYDDIIAGKEVQYWDSCSEYDHLVDGYRLGHMFGIALCHGHHEGKKGYGNPKHRWDSSKPNQWKLFEKVCKVLGKEVPEYNPKGRNNFQE